MAIKQHRYGYGHDVEYNGAFYYLKSDGTVSDSNHDDDDDHCPKVTADVIAGWGYANKLAAEVPGIEFTVTPMPDTIILSTRVKVGRDDHVMFSINISTVKTTMRRRVAKFVESVTKFTSDLNHLLTEYVVDTRRYEDGIKLTIYSWRRENRTAYMEIDDSGVYKTNVYEVLSTDSMRRGLVLRDVKRNPVVFSQSGVYKSVPLTGYLAALEREWGQILALMDRNGFKPEYDIDLEESAVAFKSAGISIVFHSVYPNKMGCRFELDHDDGEVTSFNMTGRDDRKIIKCLASLQATKKFHQWQLGGYLGWINREAGTPWKIAMVDWSDDPAGEGKTLAIIDAGKIVYDITDEDG